MNMKTLSRILTLAACLAGLVAQGATTYTFNSGFANSGNVPDGDPAGWSDTRTISGAGTVITDVNVSLNISGGYNGDLYVYLVHSSGFSVLINRMGVTGSDPFGHSGSGFNITFDDAAGTDAHNYTANGTYQVDGRNVDPATATDASTRSAFLSSFNGLDANGSWTLFVADMSGGDLTESHIVSWELEITAVPEPVQVALGIFGAVFIGAGGVRWWRRRSRPAQG